MQVGYGEMLNKCIKVNQPKQKIDITMTTTKLKKKIPKRKSKPKQTWEKKKKSNKGVVMLIGSIISLHREYGTVYSQTVNSLHLNLNFFGQMFQNNCDLSPPL